MRYTAEVLQDENDDTGYSAAVVAPACPSEALAARHARAMAAVLRASKAWHRGYHLHLSGSKAWAEMQTRLDRAVARLEKAEKEVGRG